MAEPRDIFEALFIGDDVDHGELVSSMRAAREDQELRGLFNALATADAELGGDFESCAGEAMFLGALDDMLAEEASPKVVSLSERRTDRSQVARWAVAAAAVLAVGASLVMFGRGPVEPEFQARSAATDQVKKYGAPRLEVFCVERDDSGEVKFTGSENSPLGTVACPIGQELKFAAENPDSRLKFVSVVGVSQSGEKLWYGPSPAAREAIAAPGGAELAPFGETIRLEVNHDPGTVRVVGLFTENPMTWSEFDAWAQANDANLLDGPLEVANGTAARVTFEVSP